MHLIFADQQTNLAVTLINVHQDIYQQTRLYTFIWWQKDFANLLVKENLRIPYIV